MQDTNFGENVKVKEILKNKVDNSETMYKGNSFENLNFLQNDPLSNFKITF